MSGIAPFLRSLGFYFSCVLVVFCSVTSPSAGDRLGKASLLVYSLSLLFGLVMFLEKERFVWPLQVEFCLIVGSEQAVVENFWIVS